jgi:hypothetical protein
MNCHACGGALAPTAKFCHKCGARVGVSQGAGWQAGLPWAVAGAALGALVAVVLLRVVPGGGAQTSPEPAGPVAPMMGPGGAGGTPPDISQMSPEERATRLYNRIMTLHEAGKSDSADFFLPMALQAYAMLPNLDVDARYHVGVLELTGGDAAAALAQADSIRQVSDTHLFGFMLRARALEAQKDSRGALQAYRDFLKHEAKERARKLPEYADHAKNLDAFHREALEATSGPPGSGTAN